MRLSIPFIADENYTVFVQKHLKRLSSIYYPLNDGPVLDARFRFDQIPFQNLVKSLAALKNTKKYCLLNARFVHPRFYNDSAFMDAFIPSIRTLYKSNCIDGIVINDFYLLNRLSRSGEKIFSFLEAVPGVNSMIDSIEKFYAFLDMIDQSNFQQPSRIILDRSLNRQPERLKKLVHEIKKTIPEINIELLANEGCIYHCPFKLSHDALISLANIGVAKNDTCLTNQTLGCHHYFFNHPESFLKSPFIRPEDMHLYDGLADSLKICGRTLGISFLKKTITAYIEERFDGNLLTLMDATNWLADHYDINNRMLDPDFFKLLTSCTKNCKMCRICLDLFKKVSFRQKLTLRHYKDYL